MDGMVTLGRSSLLCTLLLWSLQVCWGSVLVTVTPKVEVLKGESVSLPCTFAGSAPSVVEWFIDQDGARKRLAYLSASGEGKSDEGTPLDGRAHMDKDYSLVITPVQADDQLSYICQVTAGPSGVGEAKTELEVFFAPGKPDIEASSNQAISVTETSSSEVSQCVTRNGHPIPRIIWYKDSQPLPESKNTKDKTYMVPEILKESSGLFTVTSTLYMQPGKEDKDAQLRCKVEYTMPNKQILYHESAVIKLNLNYPSEKATFTLQNVGPVKEGDDVKMLCETDGNPPPAVFEFTKDGTSAPGDSNGGLLTVKGVKRSDAGLYRCEAVDFENPGADLSGEVTLSVNWIDPVSVQPAGPVAVMVGDQVELQCKTKGSAAHTVQWTKGSEVLSQTGVLSLKDVQFSDAGSYVCLGGVPSVPGLSTSDTLNVTVSGKPVLADPVDGSVGKVGDMVTLTCSAQGHPAPQFTWTPSGKESVAMKGNMVESSLTLAATEEVMKTGVTCQVTNEHGSDTKAFKINIKPVTVAPTQASDPAGSDNEANRGADKQQGGSSGVVIAVVICVLLLLLLVALLYCLNKHGKLPCGKKDKKDVAGGEVNNDIVVEMKTEKANEEAGLLNKPAP